MTSTLELLPVAGCAGIARSAGGYAMKRLGKLPMVNPARHVRFDFEARSLVRS